jgi:hypothetical protein
VTGPEPAESAEDAATVEATPDSSAPPSTKDKIAAAKLPERTVDICLRGDLQAEWEDLDRQLREAYGREQMDKRLNSGGESRELARRIEALQDEMRDHTIVFRMRALSRKAWGELVKQHPARKDHPDDDLLGYNPETFFVDVIRKCIYSPDDLDDAAWDHLLDEVITEHQWVSLQNAVMALNVRKVDVPNSRAASRLLRPSEPE